MDAAIDAGQKTFRGHPRHNANHAHTQEGTAAIRAHLPVTSPATSSGWKALERFNSTECSIHAECTISISAFYPIAPWNFPPTGARPAKRANLTHQLSICHLFEKIQMRLAINSMRVNPLAHIDCHKANFCFAPSKREPSS